MKYSIAKGEAPTVCPICALLAPEADEVDAVATVGGGESERGSYAILDGFRCDAEAFGGYAHTLSDLTPEQAAHILESAVEYIADAIEAMRDAADDARFHSWRDEGRYDYR